MSEYEFTEEQNSIIASLALRVTLVGVVNIIGAIALWLFFAQTGEISLLFNGIVIMLMALAFIIPMQDLTTVVREEGSDISDLRSAFTKLNNFWVIFILCYAYLRIREYITIL